MAAYELIKQLYFGDTITLLESHAITVLVTATVFTLAAYFIFLWSSKTEEQLRVASTIFESLEGMMITDADGTILRVNNAFSKITGYSAEEVVGKNPRILNSGRQDASFYAGMWNCIKLKGEWEGEIWNRRKNGEIYPEYLTITSVKRESSETSHYVATLRNIAELKQAEADRTALKDQLKATLDALPDLLFEIGLDGRIYNYHSPRTDLLAAPPEVFLGKLFTDVLPPDVSEVCASAIAEAQEKGYSIGKQYELLLARGKVCFELSVSRRLEPEGEEPHFIVLARDITERKKMEEQIRSMAFHDALTKIPNRRLLSDRLGLAMAASKRSDYYGALIFLDLDNFKPLNDTYGHDVGDLLLIEVAHRIGGCVREADTVARFGGDEFAVLLGELDRDKSASASQAVIVAEKIRVILAQNFAFKFKPKRAAETTIGHRCTASIGVALFVGHEASTEEVLKWADMAMYQAKALGGNLVRVYAPGD